MLHLVRKSSPLVFALAVAAAVLFPASVAKAAYPGANGLIAYGHRVNGNVWDIHVMNPDGTGDRMLIPDQGTGTNTPVWSPQGTRMAFVRGGCCWWDIWVAKADGSDARNLTNNGDAEGWPTWSPDGKRIAFEREVLPEAREIYVMNADGSNPQNLTHNPAWDMTPSWSPDGSKIAFASNRDGNTQIYKMNPDGSNQVRLTNNAANDGYTDWSPDSKKILFASDRDGNTEIYVMDANGSHQTRLTNDAGSDVQPAWSPDGTKIGFSSDRTGTMTAYTMNPDGSDQTKISALESWGPVWRPVTSANKTVTVSDSGFAPKNARVPQGKPLQWNFTGTASHAVADGSGLGVLGSGSEPPGGAYAAEFFGAGTYAVLDPTTLATGTVGVPIKAKPPSGPSGTTFTVIWSSAAPPSGFVFDAQVKSPGSNSWVYLAQGVTFTSTTVSPGPPGKYLFRARLVAGGAHSGWSPTASITVT